MNLIQALNIKDFKLNESTFTAKMGLSEFHAQPQGFVNGGAMLAFAEVVAGQASNLILGELGHALGQSISAQHLKATKCQGSLLVKAELLHRGTRIHVWNVQFFDERQRLISQITVNNAIVQRK